MSEHPPEEQLQEKVPDSDSEDEEAEEDEAGDPFAEVDELDYGMPQREGDKQPKVTEMINNAIEGRLPPDTNQDGTLSVPPRRQRQALVPEAPVHAIPTSRDLC